MALQAQLAISTPSYTAGQTPVPTLMLTVYNPNAAAVTVTGVELNYTDQLGNQMPRPPVITSVPPMGVGQVVVAPALSTITIGPWAIAAGSAAAASSYDMVPQSSQPALVQGAIPPQTQLWIGATVYGSDGSVNVCGKTRMLLSYTVNPPRAFQGGFAQFAGINNGCLLAAVL